MADFLDRLTLLITADANGALSVIRGFGGTAQSELKKVETAAGTSGTQAGALFGAGFGQQIQLAVGSLQAVAGGIGATLFAKSSLADAVSYERAVAGVSAGIAASGGAANVTVGSIDRLSRSIEAQDAIFQGNVKSAASLLLAFREVRNEAGANNDVFSRTLSVAAALSNFFQRDLSSVVIQLGRAMENPQAGMQALSRSGVTLDQSLRSTILHLAKQGDLLGAQKALLDELEKRYSSAGAAIAKADPFQQFNVHVKEFKTSVGEDLLPAASGLLSFGSDVLDVFGKLPGPVRATTEALVGVGVVAVPLLKVKQVLDALRATRVTGAVIDTSSVAGTTAATASLNAEAQAATTAGAATAAAGQQLSLFGAEAAGGAAGADVMAGSLTAETAAAETATVANTALSLSFGTVIAGLAAGVGSFALTNSLLNQFFGGHHTDFKTLTSDVERLGSSIKHVAEDNAFEKLAHESSIHQRIKDIEDANAGLTQILDTQGVEAAARAYGDLTNKLLAVGVPIGDIGREFGPFLDNLNATRAAAAAAGDSVSDASKEFERFAESLGELKANVNIADSFDAVQSAVDKLNADKLDAVGLGDKAVAAAQSEKQAQRQLADAQVAVGDSQQHLADSYIRLQDAQERSKLATESLLDAQKELDDFNSGRSRHERDLQLDIIQRRVVTTPAESDQKQLDLLKFQDDLGDKQESLQKQVASALRGVRDATRGVADAQRGIIDAERGVQDATQRVADAQTKVREATEKRRKVQEDAAKAAQDDERKVQEAILNTINTIGDAAKAGQLNNDEIVLWSTLLDNITNKYEPGSDLDKAVNGFFARLKVSTAIATHPPDPFSPGDSRVYDKNVVLGEIAAAPLSPEEHLRLTAIVQGTFRGKVSDPEKLFLHELGVPGFASGGMVPGLRGTPQLAVVHGGERVLTPEQQRNGGGVIVNQTNHFGGDAPATADLEYANRALGWRLSRLGRAG